MTKEEIIEKYKQDRYINPLYSLDEDEQYLINEIFLLHEKLSKLHQPTVISTVCEHNFVPSIREAKVHTCVKCNCQRVEIAN